MCIILGSFVFTVSLTGNCGTYTMQPSKYHIKFVFLWIMHSVQSLILSVNGVLLKQKTGKKHRDKILYKEWMFKCSFA